MSLEPRNKPQMLQWFGRTYPSYNLQPLLLKRQRELEEAHLQRLARGTPASPRGAAAPGRREPADGGRAPPGPSVALRARRAQGRRTCSGRSCATVKMKTLRAHGFSQRPRFEQVAGYLERNEPLPLEDDLAGDPEADALTNNGQGPPSITGRLRSAADGAQAAADLAGAGAAGLAAAQAFRSPGRSRVRPPKCVAPPRAAAAATAADHGPTRRRRAPPGQGGAAHAGGGAWRSTGHTGDGGSGCGGGRGRRRRRRRKRYLGGLAEGAAALAPTAGESAGPQLICRHFSPDLQRTRRQSPA